MSPEEEMVQWRHSGNAGVGGWGVPPPPAGLWEGSSLAGLGEMGKAFSCFTEVARVGPGHQGRPWTWPQPARLPACPS